MNSNSIDRMTMDGRDHAAGSTENPDMQSIVGSHEKHHDPLVQRKGSFFEQSPGAPRAGKSERATSPRNRKLDGAGRRGSFVPAHPDAKPQRSILKGRTPKAHDTHQSGVGVGRYGDDVPAEADADIPERQLPVQPGWKQPQQLARTSSPGLGWLTNAGASSATCKTAAVVEDSMDAGSYTSETASASSSGDNDGSSLRVVARPSSTVPTMNASGPSTYGTGIGSSAGNPSSLSLSSLQISSSGHHPSHQVPTSHPQSAVLHSAPMEDDDDAGGAPPSLPFLSSGRAAAQPGRGAGHGHVPGHRRSAVSLDSGLTATGLDLDAEDEASGRLMAADSDSEGSGTGIGATPRPSLHTPPVFRATAAGGEASSLPSVAVTDGRLRRQGSPGASSLEADDLPMRIRAPAPLSLSIDASSSNEQSRPADGLTTFGDRTGHSSSIVSPPPLPQFGGIGIAAAPALGAWSPSSGAGLGSSGLSGGRPPRVVCGQGGTGRSRSASAPVLPRMSITSPPGAPRATNKSSPSASSYSSTCGGSSVRSRGASPASSVGSSEAAAGRVVRIVTNPDVWVYTPRTAITDDLDSVRSRNGSAEASPVVAGDRPAVFFGSPSATGGIAAAASKLSAIFGGGGLQQLHSHHHQQPSHHGVVSPLAAARAEMALHSPADHEHSGSYRQDGPACAAVINIPARVVERGAGRGPVSPDVPSHAHAACDCMQYGGVCDLTCSSWNPPQESRTASASAADNTARGFAIGKADAMHSSSSVSSLHHPSHTAAGAHRRAPHSSPSSSPAIATTGRFPVAAAAAGTQSINSPLFQGPPPGIFGLRIRTTTAANQDLEVPSRDNPWTISPENAGKAGLYNVRRTAGSGPGAKRSSPHISHPSRVPGTAKAAAAAYALSKAAAAAAQQMQMDSDASNGEQTLHRFGSMSTDAMSDARSQYSTGSSGAVSQTSSVISSLPAPGSALKCPCGQSIDACGERQRSYGSLSMGSSADSSRSNSPMLIGAGLQLDGVSDTDADRQQPPSSTETSIDSSAIAANPSNQISPSNGRKRRDDREADSDSDSDGCACCTAHQQHDDQRWHHDGDRRMDEGGNDDDHDSDGKHPPSGACSCSSSVNGGKQHQHEHHAHQHKMRGEGLVSPTPVPSTSYCNHHRRGSGGSASRASSSSFPASSPPSTTIHCGICNKTVDVKPTSAANTPHVQGRAVWPSSSAAAGLDARVTACACAEASGSSTAASAHGVGLAIATAVTSTMASDGQRRTCPSSAPDGSMCSCASSAPCAARWAPMLVSPDSQFNTAGSAFTLGEAPAHAVAAASPPSQDSAAGHDPHRHHYGSGSDLTPKVQALSLETDSAGSSGRLYSHARPHR